MRLFERWGDDDGASRPSRRDVYLGAMFVLAAAVIVAKAAGRQFDEFFFGAIAVAVLLLIGTKQKIGYLAAAFAWMGFRLILGGVFRGDVRLMIWGAVWGGVAYGAAVIGARREMRDEIRRRW